MMNEFLKTEYEESFKQLRYYDDRQSFNLKMVITVSTSVSTAIFAIIKIFESDLAQSYFPISVVAFIVCIAISLIYLSMVQDRLYFTYVAKQINAIRKYSLENYAADFENNQMYLSTNVPAWKFQSSQSLIMFGVAFLAVSFFAVFIHSILSYYQFSNVICSTIISSIIVLFIQFLGPYFYLQEQGKHSADKAVHKTSE